MPSQLVAKWSAFDRVLRVMQQNPRQDGLRFVENIAEEFGVKANVNGLSSVVVMKSTVFFCTHHTGPLDFLVTYPALAKMSNNLKVIVNRQLLQLKPLESISIGVHPVSSGKKNTEVHSQVINHLKNGGNILIFPSGKVGFSSYGEVKDYAWRSGIAALAKEAALQVVPVYVNAKNSSFFYFIRKLFPKLSLLFLLRTLKDHCNKVIDVRVGTPMPVEYFKNHNPEEMTIELRRAAYELAEHIEEKANGSS